METFRHYMTKSRKTGPGSRGSTHWYIDDGGAVVYGERPELAHRQIPLKHIDTLYHVGSFDPTHKGNDSYEGAGLSVSTHPSAWMKIARLDGSEVQRLTKPTGHFLDFHRAYRNPEIMQQALAYAERAGYSERGPVTRVGRDVYYDAAQAERDAEAHRRSTGRRPKVAVTEEYRPTQALMERAAHSRLPTYWKDFALAFYAEDHVPGIDGVWWADTLSPQNYSAPRGVIFPRKVASWQRTTEAD